MTSVTDLRGVGPVMAQNLKKAGLATAEKIAAATPEDLLQVTGIGALKAPVLIATAKELVGAATPAAKPRARTAATSAAKPKPKTRTAATPAAKPKPKARTATAASKARAAEKAALKLAAEKAAKEAEEAEALRKAAEAKAAEQVLEAEAARQAAAEAAAEAKARKKAKAKAKAAKAQKKAKQLDEMFSKAKEKAKKKAKKAKEKDKKSKEKAKAPKDVNNADKTVTTHFQLLYCRAPIPVTPMACMWCWYTRSCAPFNGHDSSATVPSARPANTTTSSPTCSIRTRLTLTGSRVSTWLPGSSGVGHPDTTNTSSDTARRNGLGAMSASDMVVVFLTI